MEGSIGHEVEYDYDMELGWERRDGVLVINPNIYCAKYLESFSSGGKIWNYAAILSQEQLEQAKGRIIQKYAVQ